MDTQHDFDLWHALYRLEARYWHEVDCNGGHRAHEYYLPDGVMVVGHNRFQGREKIREFYAWRERHAPSDQQSIGRIERGAPREGVGHHQLLRCRRARAGATIQAADADRGPNRRMRAG